MLFDKLILNIVTGEFKPGQRLVERHLADQFGVSRTPLREAIRRLENLGLVQCTPNRGAIVTDFSPNDIENLYVIRIDVERLAAKFAFSNIGEGEIRRLKEINREIHLFLERGDLLRVIQKDKEFHRVIYEATGNRFLTEIVEELRLKSYIVAYYAWRHPQRVKVSVAEHKEMIKALKKRNRERFQNIVEQQLITAKSFYLEHLK